MKEPEPKDITLLFDSNRPRLTAKQAAIVVNSLVRDDYDGWPLKLHHSSGVMGKPECEWVEFSILSAKVYQNPGHMPGAHYRGILGLKGGMVTKCWCIVTPSGKEFRENYDEGDAMDDVTVEDRVKLTRLLVGEAKKVIYSQSTEKAEIKAKIRTANSIAIKPKRTSKAPKK